jgi:NAD(P)-dependent dehydrogenase (short-subunit alcohol dehydrogenase family)
MEIKERVFLVTGAGSGLGAAVSCMLVSEGAKVVGVDLNVSALDENAANLGTNFQGHRADVTNEEEVLAAVKLAKEAFGHIHGLVNCAGVAPGEKIVGRDGPHRLDSYARAIAVNLIGTFNMLRLAADAMIKEEPNAEGECGVIINTASIAAFDGQIGQAAYASSKGGVAALTLPAARELARYGVRVVAIAPGIFETPMMSGLPSQVQDSLRKNVPFPARFGRPSEYASLVRQIIENPMLNGEVIRLDGALRMAPR